MPRGIPDGNVLLDQAKDGYVLVSIAAKHCNVSRSTVHNWVAKERVKARSRRDGRHLFVRLSDVVKCAEVL